DEDLGNELLSNTFQRMQYHLDLLQWCLSKTRSEKDYNHLNSMSVLQSLEVHSVLYVMNEALNLSSQDPDEIVHQLRSGPIIGKGESVKREKAVRFTEDTHTGSDATFSRPVSIEHERDVMLYRSYVIMKHFIEVISFPSSTVYNQYRCSRKSRSSSRTNPESVQATHETRDTEESDFSESQLQRSHPASPMATQDWLAYTDIYKIQVTEKLKAGAQMLSKVFPLNYRVELLENIFSLLFCTHDDIQDDIIVENEHIDADNIHDEPVSMDTSLEQSLDVSLDQVDLNETPNIAHQMEEFSKVGHQFEITAADISIATEATPSWPHKAVPHEDPSDVTVITLEKEQLPMKEDEFQTERNIRMTPRIDSERKTSGNMSSASVLSNNQQKLGFLADEHIVRDILSTLKECIIDLNSAKYTLQGQGSSDTGIEVTPSIETELTKHLESCVKVETMQLHITRLTQYISEAQWRFQLVASSNIPRQPGSVSMATTSPSESEEDSILSESEPEESSRFLSRSTLTKKEPSLVSSKQFTDSGSATASSNSQGGRKRQRKRSRSRSRDDHSARSAKTRDVISKMLASEESLLNMCLKRGNYAQAGQVVKLFNMGDNSSAAEVEFGELYSSALHKLENIETQQRVSSTPTKTRLNAAKSSMSSLAKVAARGMQSASVSGTIDEILSGPVLPSLPLNSKISHVNSPLGSSFDADFISSMIVLDLACAASKTPEASESLLEIARKYLPSEKISPRREGTGSKKPITKMMEFVNFLNQLSAILEKGKLLNEGGVNKILTQASAPLQANQRKIYTNAYTEMESAIDKAVRSVKMLRPDTGVVRHLFTEVEKAKPEVRIAVTNLIRVLEKWSVAFGQIDHLKLGSSAEDVTKHGRLDYVSSLYEQMKTLCTLVAESESPSKDHEVLEYFNAIQEGPTEILGKLMFTNKIPPTRLEAVAQKLRLNLTHIIVTCCCPTIPSHRMSLPPDVTTTRVQHGCIVLNHGKDAEWKETPRNPELVARELLSKMRLLMKDQGLKTNASGVFNIQAAMSTIESAEYARITEATEELQHITLEGLRGQEEKVCFFVNAMNLMTLHAALYRLMENHQVPGDEDVDSLNEEDIIPISPIDGVVFTNKMAYKVGELGIVSLAMMRNLIRKSCDDIFSSEFALDLMDPWLKYLPNKDAYILSLLIDCGPISPLLVFSPDLLSQQVSEYVSSLVDNHVVLDLEKRQVSLPKCLLECVKCLQTATGDVSAEVTITWLGENGSEEFRDKLKIFTQYKDTLEIIEAVHQQDFCIYFTHQPNCQSESQLNVSSSPSNIEYSDSLDISTGSRSSRVSFQRQMTQLVKAKYNLNVPALEYIKNSSSLVATIVGLVCSDEIDDIDYEMDKRHFIDSSDATSHTGLSPMAKSLHNKIPGSGSFHSTSSQDSDISIVDIRSYRYQKLTDDFPVLKRHLEAYVIPLVGGTHPDILTTSDKVLRLTSCALDEDTRACMLLLHDTDHFRTVVHDTLDQLVEEKQWKVMLEIIDSIPAASTSHHTDLIILRDYILSHLCNQHSNPSYSESDWKYAMWIQNPTMQARVVLGGLRQWSVETCIELLKMCTQQMGLEEPLKDAVQSQLDKMNVYLVIAASAKSRQIKSSVNLYMTEDLNHDELEQLTTWQNILEASSAKPDHIIVVLTQAHEFDVARRWAKFHDIGTPYRMAIEQEALLYLLGKTPPATIQAYQLLESLSQEDSHMCLEICDGILARSSSPKDILFVTEFMLNRLRSDIDGTRIDEIHLLSIGAKMLEVLPDWCLTEYEHLISSPLLLLEQFLMNAKVEWFSKALQNAKPELHRLPSGSLGFTATVFDDLITSYASKALDFPILNMQNNIPSDTTSMISLRTNMTSTVGPPESGRTPTASSMRRSASRASLALSPRTSQSFPSSAKRHSTSAPQRESMSTTPQGFVMPSSPPSKEDWVPDETVQACMVCSVQRFSMFTRRHHCRRCGRVVCAACSSKTTIIRGISARTCDDCYQQIFRPRREAQESVQDRLKERLSGTILPVGSTPKSRVSTLSEETAVISQQDEEGLQTQEFLWQLSLDEEANEAVREEFFYEYAPSTSLCMSLLELHSLPVECGRFLLKLCDDVSKLLKPISPGVANPEVDYFFVISMLRYLLFNAKMKFLKGHDTSGIEQCEVYRSRVDLLSLLIKANCKDIPSILELTKIDSLRRMRDKLIEDERLSLAMEVSTKCGLEPMGVWVAWGTACLTAGDFKGAREKFAKCLKVPKDRNNAQEAPKILTDIISCLEAMPRVATISIPALDAPHMSIKDLIAEPPVIYAEERDLQEPQLQESLYYIKTYGNYLANVSFYRRHGYWMKAAQYIIDKKCVPEIFIEGFVVPSLDMGEFRRVEDQMLMHDPTLEKWNIYLTATCRYLMKARHMHSLYLFQIFMK
ncbi:unnamed protein product, partial [Owenia fusiformis]